VNKKDLPIIPANRIDDLHGLEIADKADLVLFMAGNQFMAMKEIVAEFKARYSEVKNIFYETLPPGLELKQILVGGAIFQNKAFNIYPDVYSSVNRAAMQRLEKEGHIGQSGYHMYLHNRLTLMVPRGNPAQVKSVGDLARGDVRISQPDPQNEDTAYHIMDMYRQAGGDELLDRIMEKKRAEGTTIFTIVHHRETPLRIAKKTVDVGPVWATETVHAQSTGLAFDVIEPGADLDQRESIDYYICRLRHALHPQSAQNFLDFILSEKGQRIYEKYGFLSGTR
jgi:ABC-type molybdate transport system substrate-binding protein